MSMRIPPPLRLIADPPVGRYPTGGATLRSGLPDLILASRGRGSGAGGSRILGLEEKPAHSGARQLCP
jgi:hypothetical protein